MKKIIVGFFSFAISFAVLAGDFQDGTSAGIDFAKSQQAHINGYANGEDSKAGQYGGSSSISTSSYPNPCKDVDANGQQMCGGENIAGQPSPSSYYGKSVTEMQTDASVKAMTDPTAQYAYDAKQDRPDYSVTKQDPLFRMQDSNQSKMVNLSDTYSGCKDIAYGGVTDSFEDKTCTKTGSPTYLSTTCQRTLTATCSNADAGALWNYQPSDFTVRGTGINKSTNGYNITFSAGRGQNCAGYDTYIDFNIDSMANIEAWNLTGVTWDDAFSVSVNGTLIWQADGGTWGVDPHRKVQVWRTLMDRCEWGSVFGHTETKDIKPFLKAGTNTIRIHHQVGGSGEITLSAYAKRYRGCNVQDAITEACPTGFDRSKAWLSASTCSVPGSTIYLGRTAVTRDCWGWTDSWQYEGQPIYQEDTMCQALRDQGCSPNGSVCNASSPSGWCQTATMNFKCPIVIPEKTMSVCGDTLVCPGGDCAAEAKPAPVNNTADFLQSASYLSMMQDMKSGFDPNAITVWKGQFKTCAIDDIIGLNDKCCNSGSGFLNDIGVSDCSNDEKAISQAKKDERETLFRAYTTCSQQVLGVCVKKVRHYDFCLWPSKLARIVQEQGKAQLGQPINSACAGFDLDNPNELQMLDWSRIDLSEYYTDVQQKYDATEKPSGGALTQEMAEKQGAMQQEYADKMEQYYGK